MCNLGTFSVEESYDLMLANVQAAASRRMAADNIKKVGAVLWRKHDHSQPRAEANLISLLPLE